MEKITDAITGALQYQYYYDAASNETKRYNWVNGVAQQYAYDALDRMSGRDLIKGTTLASETYGYNPLGQVTLIDRTGTNDDRFGYYLDGELNWATYDATALNDMTYVLDKAGNRITVVDGGVNKTYTLDTINQYTSADGSTVTNGPAEHQITSYDGVGYTYINDGALTLTGTPTNWFNFYYDALGRRVKTVRDGWATTYSYYDGEKELLECGPAGGAAFRNVYGKGIDEILARTDTTLAQTVYYQQDQNGNVTHLTGVGGAVIEKYQYDAFGRPVIYNASGAQLTESAYGNPWLFTGRRYQSTLGFYQYRARAYHPGLGRFTSEDPKLFVRRAGLGKAPDDWAFSADPEEAEFNLFRYCGNDPLDFTDPMGTEGLHDVIGGIDDFASFGLGAKAMNALSPGYSASFDRSSTEFRVGQLIGAAASMADGVGEFRVARALIKGEKLIPTVSKEGAQLAKKLASEEQMSAIKAGKGIPIAGSGTTKALRDEPRLVNQYGGKSGEWSKVTSKSYTAPDGTKIQTRAYQNTRTGQVVEQKTVIATSSQ